MKRSDHSEVRDALDAYLRARTPTSTLTLRLAAAVAQLLANDHACPAHVAIGKVPPINRAPKHRIVDHRLVSNF